MRKHNYHYDSGTCHTNTQIALIYQHNLFKMGNLKSQMRCLAKPAVSNFHAIAPSGVFKSASTRSPISSLATLLKYAWLSVDRSIR